MFFYNHLIGKLYVKRVNVFLCIFLLLFCFPTVLLAAPSFFGVASVANTYTDGTLGLAWSRASGNGTINYNIYYSTTSGGQNFAVPFSTTQNTFYKITGLDNAQAYYFVVRAEDSLGNEEKNNAELFAVPTPNPILVNADAHWKFDSNTGSTAYDSTAGANNGSIMGAAWTDGKFGSALDFDGHRDYVQLGKFLNIGTSSNSISVWVKVPSSVTSRVGVVLGNHDVTPAANWELFATARPFVYWSSGSVNDVAGPDLNDNIWHHVVWVRDKVLDTFFIYVDGVKYTTSITAGTDAAFTSTHRIGADSRFPVGSHLFKGSIDELSIYGTALTESDVIALYDSSPPYYGGLVFAADDYTGGTVDLSWDVAFDENNDAVTYKIYYSNLSGGQNFSTPDFTTQNTSYKVTGLTNGQTYYFVVRAQDSSGNEENNTVEFSVAPTLDTVVPSFFGIVSAVDVYTGGALDLSWDAASDNSNTDITYNIYYSTVSGGQNFSTPDFTTQNTSYKVTGLTNGETYYFVVRAQDFSGNEDTNSVELASVTTFDYMASATSYWTFDENSGNTISDGTLGNNDGSIVGAAWSAGRFGSALSFDGYDDYVELNKPLDIGTSSNTVSVWVKIPTSVEDRGGVVLGNHNAVPSANWELSGIARPFLYWSSGSVSSSVGPELNDGLWHHVVWVRDKELNTFFTYVDGVKYSTSALAGTDAVFTTPHRIGSDIRLGGTQMFEGEIDELFIYSYALRHEEILNIYDSTPPSFGGITSAVDAYVGGGVDLSWTPAVDDNNGIITYNIYYSAVSGQSFVTPDFVTQDTSYRLTGLTNDQAYYFVVRAEDSTGNRENNTVELSAVPTLDNVIPSFGGIVSAVDAKRNGDVDLSWDAATDNSSSIIYNIYYSVFSGGQNFTTPNASVQNNISCRVTGLINDQTYYFVVRAEDSFGNEETNDVELSAVPTSDPIVTATGYWKFDENAGNTLNDETGGGNDGSIVGASWVAGKYGSALSFDGYWDFVTLNKILNVGTSSNSVSVWVKIPSSVTDRGGVLLGNYSNTPSANWEFFNIARPFVSWGAVSTAAGPELNDGLWHHVVWVRDVVADTFYIYVDTVKYITSATAGTDAALTSIHRIGGDNRGFTGTQMFKGAVDELSIYDRALTDKDVSLLYDNIPPSFDGIVSAGDAYTGGSVNLAWNPATDNNSGAITYSIYYSTSSGGQDFTAPDFTTQNTSYQVTGLTDAQTYYFVVRAQDFLGNRDNNTVELSAAPSTDSTFPSFGGILSAVDANYDMTVELSWNPATDNSGSVTYNIYYSTSPGSQDFSTPNASVQNTPHKMAGLTNDQIYYFVVRAEDVAGNEESNIVELSAVPTFNPGVSAVAYWKFDENSGNVLSDETGGNNFGSIAGASWTVGRTGSALSFDGRSDYVQLSKILDIGTLSNTVSVWLKAPLGKVTGRGGVILGNYKGVPTANWELFNTYRPFVFWDGMAAAAGPEIDDGLWHNVVWVRDKVADTFFIYVDGVKYNTEISAGVDAAFTNFHRIGGDMRGTTGAQMFKGTIDELSIYGRAFSDEDVLKLYNSVPPSFDGLLRASDLYTGGALEVSWDSATDVNTPITYNIYYSTVSGGQNFTSPDFTTQALVYNLTGLTNDQQYYFFVRAVDSHGNEDTNTVEKSIAPTLDLMAPSFVGISSAVDPLKGGIVDVFWNPAVDNSVGMVITYKIYYSTISGGQDFSTPDLITTGSSGRVQGLTNGQVYYFVVRAEDSVGNKENNSVEMSAVPSFAALEAAVAYWRFDKNNANILYDSSDAANYGRIVGATWTDGRVGTALSFDGYYDFVQLSKVVDVGGTSNTVSAWIKIPPSVRVRGGVVLGNYNAASSANWELSGVARPFIYWSGASVSAKVGPELNDGVWHNVIWVRNKKLDTFYVYVDGVKYAASPTAGSDEQFTVPQRIGGDARFPIGKQMFKGVIDEVYIYETALTDEEIAIIYDGTPPYFAGIELAADSYYGETLDLSWKTAMDSNMPITYNIYYSTVSGGQNFSTPNLSTQAASYNLTGLANNQAYYFVVRAEDSLGNEENNSVELSVVPTLDTVLPSFGGVALAVDTSAGGEVELFWDPATDDSDALITYNVYYSTLSGTQNFAAPNVSTQSTSYKINGLTDKQFYYFVVRAEDVAGNEDLNNAEVSALPTFDPIVGAVGYWKFDENSGGVVHDETTGNNYGSKVKAAWVPGKTGSALSFDGHYDYVQLSKAIDIGMSSNTLSVWVKVPSTVIGRAGVVLGNYDASSYANWELSGVARPFIYWGDSVSGSAGIELNDDVWHHVVWVRDKALDAFFVYIDGVKYTMSLSAGTDVAFTKPQRIGGDIRPPYGSQMFKGAIDELSVYDRALNEEDVLTLYDSVPPSFGGISSATDAHTNGAVDLSWNAATDNNYAPLNYKIYYSINPGGQDFATPNLTVSGVTSHRITGLTNNQIYYFVVRAEDFVGNSEINSISQSAVPTQDTLAPSFAGLVSAADANTDGVVNLSWNPGTDVNLPLTYNIYYSNISGNQAFSVPDAVTQDTSYSVKGLTNGQIYYFVVRAKDVIGNEEGNAVEISATPTKDLISPLFGGIVLATDVNMSGAVNLSWSAAVDTSLPIKYNVYYSTISGGQDFLTPNIIVQDTASYQVTKLNNNQAYYFVVRAEDAVGNEESNTIELSVIPTFNHRAFTTAYWKFDENTGNILHDETIGVNYATISGATWVRGRVKSALRFDGSYDYAQLSKVIDIGTSSNSVSVWVKISSGVEDRVGVLLGNYDATPYVNWELSNNAKPFAYWNGTVVNGDASPSLNDGVWHHLVWVRDKILDQFFIYVDGVKYSTSAGAGIDSVFTSSHRIGGDLRSRYGPQMFQGSIDELSLYSRALSEDEILEIYNSAPPYFAGLVSAVDLNIGGSVELTWNPAVDADAPITYNIYYSTLSGSQSFTTPMFSTQSTSYIVTGLTDNQNYYFVVRSADAYGNIETNIVEKIATPTSDITPPSFGGLVSVVDTYADGTLDLSWDSASDKKVPITYNIYYSAVSGAQDFTLPNASTQSVSHSAAGLINNKKYFFVVRARDAVGNEDTNEMEMFAIPTFDPLPPLFDGIVSAVNLNTNGSVTLSWNPATDASAVVYNIYYSTTSTGQTFSTPLLTVQDTSCNITGLTNHEAYYFVVRAQDMAGNEELNTVELVAVPTFNSLTGAVASWSFNENSGSVAYDGTAGGNDGTVFGATWTAGRWGNALSFNGYSSYVQLSKPLEIGTTGNTVSVWVKVPSGVEGRGGIIMGNYDKTPFVNWELFGVSVPSVFWGSGSVNVQAGPELNDGSWHHVVWVRNQVADTFYIYVDGVKYDTMESSGNGTVFTSLHRIGADNRPPVGRIGGNNSRPAGPQMFEGLIDELFVYNIALTDSEVLTLYDSVPPSFDGIVSAADFYTDGVVELSWNTAIDSGGAINYNVYYSITSGGQDFSTPNVVTQNTSYQVEGLVNDQVYYFVVRSEDFVGNEDSNGVELSSVPTSDVTPPSFGGLAFAVDNSKGGEISLGWLPAFDDTPYAITYNVYYSTTSGGQNFSVPSDVIQNVTSFVVNGLINGQGYYFVVRAEDRAGNEDANTDEIYVVPSFDSVIGAVSYWNFDENNGDKIHDVSAAEEEDEHSDDEHGNGRKNSSKYKHGMHEHVGGNDGNIIGAEWVSGRTGGALSFDGNGDYVHLDNVLDIGNTSNTVSVWVKIPSSVTNRAGILLGNYDGSSGASWEFSSVARPFVYWSGGSVNAVAGPELNDGLWHHVVWVRNKALNSFFVYVDGVKYVTPITAGTDFDFTSVHRIGSDARSTVGSQMFKGVIDDLSIYDRALVDSEILNLYDSVPPVFSGLASSIDANTDGAVLLSWSSGTDNRNTALTYNIYYSTTSGEQDFNSPSAITQDTSYLLTGLVNGQVYYFVVRGEDFAGNEENNFIEFSVSPSLDVEPPVFSGLTSSVDAYVDGTIDLYWNAATDNSIADINYNIYYSTTPGAQNFAVSKVVTKNLSYTVTGLVNGQVYYFVVRAEDFVGNMETNNVEKSAIPTLDTVSPSFGGITSALPSGINNSVRLLWNSAVDDGNSAITYNVYYSTVSGGQNFSVPKYSTQDTSCLVTGLINEQIYYFIVKAEDSAGNEENNAVELPAVPINNVLLSGAVAYWNFDENMGDTLYDVSGSNDGAIVRASWANGRSGSALSFDGNDNYVQLSEVMDMCTGSNTVSVWVKVPLQLLGRAGIILGNNYGSGPSVNWELGDGGAKPYIYWNSGEESGSVGPHLNDDTWHHLAWVRDRSLNRMFLYIDGFMYFTPIRALSNVVFTSTHRIGGDNRTPVGSQMFDGLIDDLAIFDRALSNAEIVSLADNRPPSDLWTSSDWYKIYNPFCGLASAEDARTDGAVKLFWAPTFDISTPVKYSIYYSTTPGGQNLLAPDFTMVHDEPSVRYPVSGYNITGLTNAQVYYFIVRSEDSVGNRDSNTVELAVTPTMDNISPHFDGLVSIADGYTDGAVELSWNTAVDNNRGEVTYNIYYSTVSGGQNFSLPSAVTQNNAYQFTGLTNDQIYYFVVRAEDSYGNEDNNSVELSAKPVFNIVLGSAKFYWKFDEGSGSIANASNGGANTGSITGAAWTPGKTGTALSFDGVDDYVELSKIIDIGMSSNTVSAWLKVSPSVTNRAGVVLGNYDMTLSANWELTSVARPTVYWSGGSQSDMAGPDINDGLWHHVVWVRDKGANTFLIYVDSVKYTASIDSGTDIPFTTTHRIGGDARALNLSPMFNGVIDELSIYDRALSAGEVLSLFGYMPTANAGPDQELDDTDGNGFERIRLDGTFSQNLYGTINKYEWYEDGVLIASVAKPRLDFSSGVHDITLIVTDNASNTASDKMKITVVTEKAFRIAIIPDTQYYTYVPKGLLDVLYSQLNWIVANKDLKNFKFALQEGDITIYNTAEELGAASDAFSVMDGNIPYSILPGNHDGIHIYRDTTMFDTYFPESRFRNSPTFGGVFEQGKMGNHYQLFSAGGTDWLVMSIEFAPIDDVLEWANQIVAKFGSRRIIFVTHGYLYYDGTRLGSDVKHLVTPAYLSLGDGNNGEEIWRKFVSLHPNISFVFSGHIDEPGYRGRNVSYGKFGNKVYETLVDYEVMSKVRETSGYFRLFEIDVDRKTVSSEAYSPYLDSYLTGSGDKFIYTDVDLGPPPALHADAGADQDMVDADADDSEIVTLDGSASFDPYGTITSYKWSEGASVIGTGATLTTPLPVGVHKITLTVTSSEGWSDTNKFANIDTITVTINEAVPMPPSFGGIVQALDVRADGAVNLSWNVAIDPSLPISYSVYYSTVSGEQSFSTPSLVTQDTSCQITGLTNGQVYYFVVRSEDSFGNKENNTVELSAVPTMTPPPESVLAHWSFDENVDNIAYDETSNGNDGTIVGATWTVGKYGSALSFDGIDDYVELSKVIDVGSIGNTVSVWVKVPSSVTARAGVVLGNKTTELLGVNWELKYLAKPYIYWNDNSLTGSVGPDLNDGLWHNVVWVRDKSADRFFVYVDSVKYTLASSAGIDTVFENIQRIGADRVSITAPRLFHGSMDELYVYDRALSDAEILNLYDNTAPSFAGLLSSADSYTDGSVDLSWSAAIDDNIGTIKYNIYYSTVSGGQNFSSPNDITQSTSYRVTGLTNEQSYYFVVRAEDSVGNEDTNTLESLVIPTKDNVPPSFSGLLSCVDADIGQTVELSWNAAIDDSGGAVTYNIYYSTVSNGQNFSSPDATAQQSTPYRLGGLTNGQTYYFVVRAEDYLGNEEVNTVEYSAAPTTDSIPPSFTGLLHAVDGLTVGAVDLYWDAATDNNVAAITYNIYYSTVPGAQNFTTPDVITQALSYSVTDLAAGQTYYFVVRADDSFGNEETNTVELSPVQGSVLEVSVSVSSDDAEEYTSGDVYLVSSDLELISTEDVPGQIEEQKIGIRFRDITIPVGSVILKAYIQFQTDEQSASATSLTIMGVASDNTGTFVSASNNVSSRPLTNTSVLWENIPAWNTVGEAGQNQRTPDIKSLLQEIIGRPFWKSGNALAVVITGSGKRVAEAYDGVTYAPRLHVEYY